MSVTARTSAFGPGASGRVAVHVAKPSFDSTSTPFTCTLRTSLCVSLAVPRRITSAAEVRETGSGYTNEPVGGCTSVEDVTSNVAEPSPTTRSASTTPPGVAEDVTRSFTVCPSSISPATAVNAVPSIEYSPPDTEIGVGTSMPVIVTAFDSTTTERGTSTAAENANASGIVSIVVAANVPLTPPIVSSASTVVSGAPAAVTLSATVSPGAIVPASDVNGPPSIEYSPAAT